MKPIVETEPDFAEVEPERELVWHDLGNAAANNECPPSKNSSVCSLILFENRRSEPVTIHWIDPQGNRRSQGKPVQPGDGRRIRTFVGHSFLITDTNDPARLRRRRRPACTREDSQGCRSRRIERDGTIVERA